MKIEIVPIGYVKNEVKDRKAEVRQDGNSLPVLNLGPISVHLEYQRLGVGKFSEVCHGMQIVGKARY